MSASSFVVPLSAPLQSGRWESANRAYVARSISELLHEKLLGVEATPLPNGRSKLRLKADTDACRWTCEGVHRQLDHWHVFPETVKREDANGAETTGWDAARFYLDHQKGIGIEPFTMARFIEETNQTLYSDAVILERGRPTSDDLAKADHATIERAMEGHPWILVNKGRMGFGGTEQKQFAPETGNLVRLVWLAAHKDVAKTYTLEGLFYNALLEQELGDEFRDVLGKLTAQGFNAADYVLIPAHPWQYSNKLVVQFASEIAAGRLVTLGESRAEYRPQQSIRTFQNAAHPERSFIKTSLSILNTGQIRGLSPVKLAVAPTVTQWLREHLSDKELTSLGFTFLGEIATVAYEHPAYEAVPGVPYQYREMLGALFRESALPKLRAGESLATMASLLYVDDAGKPLVQAFAERAKLPLNEWLEQYLRAYLRPLLHCFFAHETFFVAHGENTMLVLENGRPTRVVLKDLVEEVQMSKTARAKLPEHIQALLYDLDDSLIPLSILTDVFDGYFRYLSDVVATHCGFAESGFWALVAKTVSDYQTDHPELRATYERFNLWVETYPRFCLNKCRLVLFGYADVADNVVDTDPKFTGTLDNPIVKARGDA